MQNRFSLRKLTIGLASVSLGMFFMQTSNQVKADTVPATTTVTKEAGQTDQPGQPGQPGQTDQPGQPGQTDQTTPTSTSRDNSTGHSSQNLVTRPTTLALFKQAKPVTHSDPTAPSATDPTKPIAPSTTVPSYDGTKVVDTPFYNNSRGTNSNASISSRTSFDFLKICSTRASIISER